MTLDAYVAHNAAVKVQQQWQSHHGPAGTICSLLYKHPHATQAAAEAATSAADKRADQIAADACAKGVQLQPWNSDAMEQQLAAKQQQHKAEERASSNTADGVALKLIKANPDSCDAMKASSAKEMEQNSQAGIKAVEAVLKQHPELVPSSTTAFDIANSYASACVIGSKGAEQVLSK